MPPDGIDAEMQEAIGLIVEALQLLTVAHGRCVG